MILLAIPFADKDWAKAQAPGKLRWNPPGFTRDWYFDGDRKELPPSLEKYLPASAAAQKRFRVLCLPFQMQQFAGSLGSVWQGQWRVNYWYGEDKDLPAQLTGFEPKAFSYEAYVEQVLNKQDTPVLKDTGAITLRPDQEVARKEIHKTFDRGVTTFLLGDDVGLGKAQPLTAKILTPKGWVTMGSLRIGDTVTDPDGGVGTVRGIFSQGTKPIYRVTFSDHTTTECCEDHLWLVFTANDRRRGTSRVLPLKAFADKLKRKHGNSSWKISNYFVPITQPVTYSQEAELPLDPWLLGALLGNGGMSQRSIHLTTSEPHIVNRTKAVLPNNVALTPTQEQVTWRLKRTINNRPNAVRAALEILGLARKLSIEKSIPRCYLQASIPQRIELLKGLMDTDGDITTEGIACFSTSSPQLASDTIELARSLGAIVTSGTKKKPKYSYNGETRIGKASHRLNIRTPFNPFSLPRKAERWKPPIMAKSFSSVELVEEKEAQCIEVSTKRHLYVTDDFNVTHNTITTWGTVLSYFKTPVKVAIVAPPDIHPNWRNTIKMMGNNGHTVVILNYERLRNLYHEPKYSSDKAKKIGRRRNLKRIANNGEPKDFDVYIWDESHYIKNLSAARTQLAIALYRPETYHIWLSATAGQDPLELAYLLPLLRAKTEGKFELEPPDSDDFEAWYKKVGIRVKRGAFGKWQVGETDEERKEDCDKLADILWKPNRMGINGALRRTPTDIAGWPEIQRIPWAVELNTEELRQYNQEWATFLAAFKEERARGKKGGDQGAVALLRFRMKASMLRAQHTADFAAELVANKLQVAISCEWHTTMDEIGKELEKHKIDYAKITGRETGAIRESEREKYQMGEVKVILFNIKEGINLHEGEMRKNDIPRAQIDHDIRWSAIQMHQIDGRSHRNGKFAKIYWAYADGTQEETVAYRLLERLKSMKTMLGEQDIKMEELEKAFTGMVPR